MEQIFPFAGLNDEHHLSQAQIASSTFPATERWVWNMFMSHWLMYEVSLVKRCTNVLTLRSIHPPQNRTKQDPNLSIARGACSSTSRDRRGIRQNQAARSLPTFAPQHPHADLRSSSRATLTHFPLSRTRGPSLAQKGEGWRPWLVRGHARVPGLASSRAQ